MFTLFSESHEDFEETLKIAKERIEKLKLGQPSDNKSEDVSKETSDAFNAASEDEKALYSVYDIPIESVQNAEINPNQFSVRTYNCLRRGNISSIHQLLKSNLKYLSNIKNMGAKSIDEVVAFIRTGIIIEETPAVNDE